LAAQDAADEGANVMSFLLSVQKPNLVAFEITTCEMAYGLSWSTNWTVLDMAETNG
jgi:hypothetical protein